MSQQTFYQPNRRRREEDDAYSDNQGWSPNPTTNRSSEVSNNAQQTINNIDNLLSGEESPAEVTSSSAAADSRQLRSSEESGGEANPMNFTGGKNIENGRQKKFRGMLTRKRVGIAGGVAGVGIGGGLLGLSLLSGPFQFIHAAQVLQQLHFSSNEDFGDSRGSKVLLYALAGGGAERTRLGKVMNPVADKWEKTLVKDTGLRPIYSTRTGYFRGFEVTDEAKARDKMPELFDDSIEGTKVTTAADAAKAGQGVRSTQKITGGSADLPGDTKIIDVKDMTKFSAKRSLISTVGKATDTSKLVSTIASRLLKKRAGVNFHPLGTTRNAKEKLADYWDRVRNKEATDVENGVDPNSVKAEEKKDKKGNVTNKDDIDTADGTDTLLKDVSESTAKNAVKDTVQKVGKGALAVGILCAAKGFGNDIPDYKYTHDALPMMRMGMEIVTVGNEVMSGQDVNMDELGAFNQQMYDPATKTSFFDAASIKYSYNENMQGAVEVPKSASLGNINSKPFFFNILDDIPLLSQACSLQGAVSHIPVIGNVLNYASELAVKLGDAVLAPFGTSFEGLMEGALSIASGKGVDPLATGGSYGALADSGAFLSANDNAMSMGGAALTPTQTAELNASTQSEIKQQRASESIASRYLNPYDYASLVGSAIDSMPHSITQVADGLANPLQQIGSIFSRLGSVFTPSSSAAAIRTYNYGVPQFGFSMADQNNSKFEDPYANAAIVEPKLDELNSKYGKCFGMTATVTADGVTLTSASMGDANLNQFKIADNSTCHSNSEDFLRYRFYLADAVAASSLACDETNDAQSCANVGIGDTTSTPASTTPTSPGTYKNPLRDLKNIYPERIDGGVDYNANDGPVYAVGDGKVIGVRTGGSSGWPGNPGLYLLYKLTDGPAQGKYVYMAEDCSPTVKAGDTVTADTKICNYHYSGTAMEMGWSNGSYGYLTDDYNSHGGGSYASNSGQDFSKFLVSLGAPPGKVEGTKSTVPMPSGWPTW